MGIISNTTVLSNFAAIGQLDLLRQLYDVLYIPTEVYEEMRDGLIEMKRALATLSTKGWWLSGK